MLVESIPLAHSSLLDKSAVVSEPFRLGVGWDARTLTKRKRETSRKKEQEIIAGILFLPYAPLGNDVNDDGNKALLIQVWD